MPRRARFIKRPEIMLDATLPVPLYKQLYERLRGTILVGQLERGARLPSTRPLGQQPGCFSPLALRGASPIIVRVLGDWNRP